MVSYQENIDLECFLVTKHSWKGKYKRLLCIGSVGISTYNPEKYELTNRWSYADVLAASPNKAPNIFNEFVLTVKKDKKLDTIKFSCDFRNDVLSSILKYYKEFADKPKNNQRFGAYKYHWSGVSLPTMLEVTPCSLDQLDPTTHEVLCSYMYKDIEGIIAGISDYEGGIVLAYGGFTRLHCFKALNHHEIVQNIAQKSLQFLSVETKILKSQISLEQFERQRFGKYSDDQFQTSVTEFTVQKITSRHPDPVRRILCLTDTTLLERDPQTYSVCTLRPLTEIFAIIREKDSLQRFSIEYKNGIVRRYNTNDRDSLLATLLDAVRSSGNKNVHIRMKFTPREKRFVPLFTSVDEECEANLLRAIINNFHIPNKRHDILDRFNANIPHSGLNYSVTQDSLFAENKEKLIISALQSLAQKESDNPSTQLANEELEAIFHGLTRLLASKTGYAAFTNLPEFRQIIGMKVVVALKRNDLAVTYSAIDMINSLMHSVNADNDLKQEQLNKSSLLSSESFLKTLLEMWIGHVVHGSGALVLSAMLDFLTFALCVPYSETTDGKQFDVLLNLVAERGRYLYKLFQHPSLAIIKGAGLVLRSIIEEGEHDIAQQMQSLALDEGAVCRHLLVALFTPSNDPTLASHRQLSRHLINLWVTDNIAAMDLFKRIFPAGLLMFLENEDEVPEGDQEEDKLNFRDNLKFAIQHSNKDKRNVIEKHLNYLKHWGIHLLDQQDSVSQALKNRPVVLRNRRQRSSNNDKVLNFPYFYHNFHKDHSIPNLIWNHKTREELRICLENELRQFLNDRDLTVNSIVAWNYEEFEVIYQSLSDEIQIGDYYIRLILEKENWPQNLVKNPTELFNALYRRILCRQRLNDDQLTVTSLQALAKVYERYYKDIGYFSDMPYVLQLCDRSSSPSLRDALINLVYYLVLEKSNCRAIVDHIQCLVDLITLAHLHNNRTKFNTKSNVIESGNIKITEENDWYYNVEKEGQKSERKGPIPFSELKELWNNGIITSKTRCWAAGMDGWRPMQQIPQLKWCIIVKGLSIFNETELACKILDILIKCTNFFPSRSQNGAILIPGPKLSRKLSEYSCLTHIVQVCLTHEPRLLERVATLLCQIMENNPDMTKVYLTGVFYFMLMYNGSNILPITKFLKMAHMKQGFKNDESSESGVFHRSILGQLLPEAMVCYLEDYSAEKFAEIFLGEFDTPEVIWSSEMRRLLIEKIAAHIADFTPKLRGHTMARYPYLAIPAISYPQLDNELFCYKYYLRHLCDSKKFPNWHISDPIQLLKHTLNAWRKEVEKKPSAMTVQQAYQDLGIDLFTVKKPDESMIRKNYYRLAQMYHPDKNPNGKEQFQKVNQAYDFLCSRALWRCNGPDSNSILLILQTQCILFERYSDALRPYKYAGYSQLIKTIRMETRDEDLFSKEVQLLSAASELCYHTVHCSALNAEELRREEGIEALLEAYSRCVSIMNSDSNPMSLHYKVVTNVTLCFEIACNFEKFKEKIVTLPQLLSDVCRVVFYKHIHSVSLVTSLAANNYKLQSDLVRNGVLWSLLLFCFDYDYTLDESGVDASENTNRQKLMNNLAKMAVIGCISLAGYTLDRCEATVATSVNNKDQRVELLKVSDNTLKYTENYAKNANNLLQNLNIDQKRDNSSQEDIISVTNISKSDKHSAAHNDRLHPNNDNSTLINKYQVKSSSADNIIVKQVLDILLTKYISDKLSKETPSEILKMLTSNTRNPYFIWDNGTRSQLIEFLELQRHLSQKQTFEELEHVLGSAKMLKYNAHKEELQIGDIFIRVYNEMPTFVIAAPEQFISDLLEYLRQAFVYVSLKNSNKDDIFQVEVKSKPLIAQQFNIKEERTFDEVLDAYNRSKNRNKTDLNKEQKTTATKQYKFTDVEKLENNIVSVLCALKNVIHANEKSELRCNGHFEMIFSLMATKMLRNNTLIKSVAVDVIELVSRNKECIKDISSAELIGTFLVALKDPDLEIEQIKLLETLSHLMNLQEIIKEAQMKGVIIYLLDIFCNAGNPQIRDKCTEIMAKMATDRLNGPKVRITISKFLPPLFINAMIDSPTTVVQLFESVQEHPELIWNDKTKRKVCESVRDICESFYQSQKNNPKQCWKDPEVLKEIILDEIVISGVYLRLFVSNPAWTLRKPKLFLSELLDFVVNQLSRSPIEHDVLDLATTSLIELLKSQPNLADDIPVLGHIPKLFNMLSLNPKFTLAVLHQIALSELCVAAISQTQCILPLKKCMEKNEDCFEKCCETLSRLLKYQNDSLITQSLDANIISYLLDILDSKLSQISGRCAVKAHIVTALKRMTNNNTYGERVITQLHQHPVWTDFKDQRHDLFISDIPIGGYLTGTNSVAGYLTQAPVQNVEILTSPPPIDKDDTSVRRPLN